jgi:hypothetical protein
MSTYITAYEISAKFTNLLAAELSSEKMDAISDDNAKERNPNICHSHDHCDANEVMAAAFLAVVGREMDLQSDTDGELWDRAFKAFRFFGARVGRALSAAGFQLQHQGGGMFNWRKEVASGLDMFCCGEDGQEPDDSSECTFGVALQASDSLADKTYKTGLELATILNARAA